MEIVQNFGYHETNDDDKPPSKHSSQDTITEKSVYILVEPKEVGFYVMSASWSDAENVEKINRRKIKLFSKDHQLYLDQCSQIYQKNKITSIHKKNAEFKSFIQENTKNIDFLPHSSQEKTIKIQQMALAK